MTAPPICEHAKCKALAVAVLAGDVPPQGEPFRADNTARMCFGEKLCAGHYRAAKVRERFTDETRAAITAAFQGLGRLPPDFRRIRKSKMALNDPVVIDLDARKATLPKPVLH